MKKQLEKTTKRLLVVFYALLLLSVIFNLVLNNTDASILCIVLASGLITLYNRRAIKEIVEKLEE